MSTHTDREHNPLDLIQALAPQATPRRLRLLVAGFARQFLPYSNSEWPRQLVEQMESLAEGRRKRSLDEVLRHLDRLRTRLRDAGPDDHEAARHLLVLTQVRNLGLHSEAVSPGVLRWLLEDCLEVAEHLAPPEERDERRRRVFRAWAALIQDVLGGRVERARFDPGWRDSMVVGLARRIQQARDFAMIPILGDALEDAGCYEEAILEHCRATIPHVPGCWVVDLCLAREDGAFEI